MIREVTKEPVFAASSLYLKMKIFKPIPSFIMAGGIRIKVVYEGQTRTCPRCSAAWASCPGGGNPETCQKNKGEKSDLKALFEDFFESNTPYTEEFLTKPTDESAEEVEDVEEKQDDKPKTVLELTGAPISKQPKEIVDYLKMKTGYELKPEQLEATNVPGRFKVLDVTNKDEIMEKINSIKWNKKRITVIEVMPVTPEKVADSSDSSIEVVGVVNANEQSTDSSGSEVNFPVDRTDSEDPDAVIEKGPEEVSYRLSEDEKRAGKLLMRIRKEMTQSGRTGQVEQ